MSPMSVMLISKNKLLLSTLESRLVQKLDCRLNYNSVMKP